MIESPLFWPLFALLVLLGLAAGLMLGRRPVGALRRQLEEEAQARAAERAAAAQALEAERSAHVETRLGRVAAEERAARTPDLEAGLAAARSEREALAARLAALEAEAAARAQAFEEERARLVAAGEALKAEFARLSAEALKGSQEQFLQMAEAAVKRQRELGDATLEQKRAALAELLKPIGETLKGYEARLAEVEKARVEGYGQLTALLSEIGKTQAAAITATTRLETALRSSGKSAGRWGEEQCRNVLESAGLVEGVDFEEQFSVDGDAGRQRPDFIISLPGGRSLVIDVKCSLDAFVSAIEADDEAARTRALKAHAAAVRAHASGLASKSYASAVPGAVDFVVLFVPGENFLAAAMEQDRTLMRDFMDKRVVLAGPINLVAVARTVAAMRDQARLAKEAAEIAKLGRDLYDSLRIMGGNITAVQASLAKTVENWNRFVGQMDSRVMLRARRFETSGATTGLAQLPDLPPVEAVPRLPAAPELIAPPAAATPAGDAAALPRAAE